METGFSCRDVTLQPAHSASKPARAGLGIGTLLLHTLLTAGEKLRAAERRGPALLGTGAPSGPRTARGAPRNRCGTDSRRGTPPARVIHRSQRCGPAESGGEVGAAAEGLQGAPAWGVEQPPPLPSPASAQPGATGALRDGPAPRSPFPVPFPAGGPCSRSGRRWGR